MIKKIKNFKFKYFLIFFLIVLIYASLNIKAQNPADIPVIGKVNPETGLPDSFDKFKESAENLSKEEIRKEYLKREWTKILAKNEVLGPILFYTDKFFSFFNPIWKFAFGIEFSWSWQFFLSIILWITIIIIIYNPLKAFTNLNTFLNIIISMIVAILAGSGGVIKTATEFLNIFITNIWLIGIILLLFIIFLYFYPEFFDKLGKELKEEEEKEKLERSKENIFGAGKVSQEFFKNK